jgi:hypothetical protein
MGTEPHSHPGSTTPAQPATGTASAGRPGSARAKKEADTSVEIAALTTTPSTGKGTAWITGETNTVTHACTAG